MHTIDPGENGPENSGVTIHDLTQRCSTRRIRLTAIHPEGEATVMVTASHLLTYAENPGFTRLRLRGGRTLEVRETTDHIDRLIRAAANNCDI